MQRRNAVACTVLLTLPALGASAADRQWRTGKIVNIESQMIHADYERRHYHIDGGEDVIYVAFEEGWAKSANGYAQVMSFGLAPKKQKFADVTVNGSVRFALAGRWVYIVDENNKERKLELYSKIRKPPVEASVAAPVSAPADPAAATTSEIRRGMAMAEVEQALGKPTRTVSFEERTQWMYPRLVVVFEKGTVIDVSF